jgi:L-fucose mutarotase
LNSESEENMLKGIPKIISPELLKVLCEMGHGDRLVIADANFPSESIGKNSKVIRMDGHTATDVLKAVLQLIPLDTYVEKPVYLMQKVPGDNVETPIWNEYAEIINRIGGTDASHIGNIERFEFYEQAKSAYCIIATGESALYANVMLQKGVITGE